MYEYDVGNGWFVRSHVNGNDHGFQFPTGFDFVPGWSRDCNLSHLLDSCDIASGASEDGDGNGVPDECEADCNQNGQSDQLDLIPFGSSYDCDFDRIPDECEGGGGACPKGMASSACAVAPIAGCTEAGEADLVIDERRRLSERLSLSLEAFQTPIDRTQLGDPVNGSTRYAICLYDSADQLAGSWTVDRAGGVCGAPPKYWRAIGASGFGYRDSAGLASGISRIATRSGDVVRARVAIEGRNRPLRPRSPTGIAQALADRPTATVQVVTSDAGCFEAALVAHVADGSRFEAAAQ
jgi:hypothetical protein